MRVVGAILLVALAVSACGESVTLSTIREDRLRPEGFVGTWVPPPNEEPELLGTWTSSSSLVLNEDGTYSFDNTFGRDEGEYRDRRKAALLRLNTTFGVGFCSEGETSRLEYTVESHPAGDADRLWVRFGMNRCGSSFFPESLDRVGRGTDGDGLVGEWRSELTLTLARGGRYLLKSHLGQDTGRFEYEDGRIEMVTEEGELCEPGDTARGGIGTRVVTPTGTLDFNPREDQCWARSGLGTTLEWIAGP